MVADISEIKVKEDLIKPGVVVGSVNPGIFYWEKKNCLNSILACHINDMILMFNENHKVSIIGRLKDTFVFGLEETQAG